MLLGLVLLDGLATGGVIFLVAVRLNLIFGVLRIINIAHGSLYAIGAYGAASLGVFFAARGLPAWASVVALLVAAILVGVLLGPLLERLILRRIYAEEEVVPLLGTFALFIILENTQKLIWACGRYISRYIMMRRCGCSAPLMCPLAKTRSPSPAISCFFCPASL